MMGVPGCATRGRPKKARIAHWRARYALVLMWFLPAVAVLVFLLGAVILHQGKHLLGGWRGCLPRRARFETPGPTTLRPSDSRHAGPRAGPRAGTALASSSVEPVGEAAHSHRNLRHVVVRGRVAETVGRVGIEDQRQGLA